MVQQVSGGAAESEMAPGRTAVTIRDVAEHAGVSAGTVSNVLNRPFYVNADTREKVMTSIRALDFVPKQRARQFRPGRVRSLGIAVADLGNPFFVDVALGAEGVARAQGIGVVISNSGHDAEHENHNLELLIQQKVQGLIISPVDEASSQIQMLRDRGVPMVFVDRVGEDQANAWSVVVDDGIGGRLAAEHVVRQGHRRIGFLGHPERSPKVRRRLEGVREALGVQVAAAQPSRVLPALGERPDGVGTSAVSAPEAEVPGPSDDPSARLELLETPTWTVEAGRQVAERFLARPHEERPTALICANDLLALGALQVLIRHGVRVPEEVAVVGYDDLEWAAVATPPLTTVRQPRHELGAAAVEMIMDLFDGGGDGETAHETSAGPRHVVLEPELIVRGTA